MTDTTTAVQKMTGRILRALSNFASVPTVFPALRTVRATRYVTPLREGGSLPGLVEADDDGMYVVKFRGAGQGTAALVAEIVVGELGRRIGVRVPDLVGVELDPVIGL